MAIRKSKLLFALGLFCAFWSMSVMCFGYTATAIAAKLTLRSGTPVILSLEKSISTDTAIVGDPVDLIVIRDVKVDGKVVISTGTGARGEISAVEKEGIIGKPGRISITVKSVTGVDGTGVPIKNLDNILLNHYYNKKI